MVDELVWPIEEIPDTDFVFMRANRVYFPYGGLMPGIFRAHGACMSVNWDKYASAEETKQQATKGPDDNAVIRMPVIGIRQTEALRVEHTPEPTNRAHSGVYGLENHKQLTEVRVLLLRISKVVIPLTSR